jgi:hypothetical protein
VGISGDTARYMGATTNDLTSVAVYETNPGIEANASTEALIATYSAASATVGSARILVTYGEPL